MSTPTATTTATRHNGQPPSILDKMENVRQIPSGWLARCPGHEDTQASLSIATGDEGRMDERQLNE